MSFILDALKKSEIERQRQSVPGLMDARGAARRGRLPVWAVALGVLLAINLLVLTVVLMRKGAPVAPAPPPVETPQIAPVAVPAIAPHFSPLDAAPVYAPEIPVAGIPVAGTPVAGTPAAGADSPAESSPSRQTAPPAGVVKSGAKPLRRSDPLLSDAEANAEAEEVLPTISEMNLGGAQALPELHLDVHVYASSPADRFVYINMRKYHEGGTLREGPIVEHIRRDGVVLNYQGLRFILPRQP
jgi:general secretion pathway protein B